MFLHLVSRGDKSLFHPPLQTLGTISSSSGCSHAANANRYCVLRTVMLSRSCRRSCRCWKEEWPSTNRRVLNECERLLLSAVTLPSSSRLFQSDADVFFTPHTNSDTCTLHRGGDANIKPFYPESICDGGYCSLDSGSWPIIHSLGTFYFQVVTKDLDLQNSTCKQTSQCDILTSCSFVTSMSVPRGL